MDGSPRVYVGLLTFTQACSHLCLANAEWVGRCCLHSVGSEF